MATITANFATRPRRRYLLDRPELIGPLFVAPAILCVAVLVALPFFLAIYLL
jgi:multiple sugar transport system permease protein